MTSTTAPRAPGRPGPEAGERILLQIGAISGVAGLALRLAASASERQLAPGDPVGAIFGQPEAGVWPAVAGALGALLVTISLITAYRSTPRRDIARRIGSVAILSILLAAAAGIGVAVDTALVGGAFLALGGAILAGSEDQAWTGWLGLGAGLVLTLLALPALDVPQRTRDMEQLAGAGSSAFVVALSVALWLRSTEAGRLAGGIGR